MAFAKVALLRADNRPDEAEALLKELEAKLPPEVFRTCVNDPMLVMRTATSDEAQSGVVQPK